MKLTINIPGKDKSIKVKTDNSPLRIHGDGKTVDGNRYKGKGRKLIEKVISK